MDIRKYLYTALDQTEYSENIICEAINICSKDCDRENVITPQSISRGNCIRNIIETSYRFCWDCVLFPEILNEVFAVYISGYAAHNDLYEQDYQICNASGRISYSRIKNFYMDAAKKFGFIHSTVDLGSLPNELRTSLAQLTEAEYYTGNRYYIFHSGDKSFAYRAQPFEIIKELISHIKANITYGVDIVGYKISKNGEWAVVEIAEGSIFIIKREEDFIAAVKKEKANLNYGLNQSKSFFPISPDKVDWAKLKPKHGNTFEALCELILRNDSRFKIVPRGKTNSPDGGRDFEAEETEDGQKIKWAIQCKFSLNRSISLNQISDWFCNLAEPDIDGYWLMTNNDISPSIIDQFKKISKKFPNIRTKIWQRTDFDNLKDKYPQLFNSDFFDN